jgi:LPPG:FO 2-phospho-L-lactate transferase
MLVSLGHEASALGVARLYAGLVDGLVIDTVDAALAPAVEALGMRTLVTDAIMTDDASRERLAREVLAFGRAVRA